jgi:hypothetical protein
MRRTKNPVRAIRSASKRMKERRGHVKMGTEGGSTEELGSGSWDEGF